MQKGYRLKIYKVDRRYKAGERWFGDYDYPSWSQQAVVNEVRDLQQRLYRPADGWRIEVHPMTVTVRNLMTGKDVEIDSRDAGGPCDPSTERYWSM